MTMPTCESEFGIYGCSGGAPTGGARPWIASDLLINRSPRYNFQGSFYTPNEFGGAFGPVVASNVPDPADSVPVYSANGTQIVTSATPVANRNHLEANSLAPILIIGVIAFLALKG